MSLQKTITVQRPWQDDTRFCRPECLLLDGLRLWSQNPENLAYVRRIMTAEVGPQSSTRIIKALKLLGHLVGLHARRTFRLRHPGAQGATADERALIAMIGAVLHERRSQAHAIAEWLLPVACHGTVLALAGELGRAMRAAGLEIAPPRHAVAPQSGDVRLRTVA